MDTHGFLTRDQLRALGYGVARIRTEIEAGELERVIRGWYCRPGTDRGAVKALRLGGRITCVSSLRLAGAWCPPDPGLHVGFPSHASGRRLELIEAPHGTVRHWHPKEAATGSAFAVTPVDRAVLDVLACQPPHFAVAVLDSLLHRRLISRNRLDAIVLHGPPRSRVLSDRLNGGSEAGIESIVRFLLESAGVRVRIQVVVRDRYRVDLIVGDRLVLEIDGRATHAQQDAFTADRVRIATIMRDGRMVLQFAYATVVYDADFLIGVVLDVMAHHAPIR